MPQVRPVANLITGQAHLRGLGEPVPPKGVPPLALCLKRGQSVLKAQRLLSKSGLPVAVTGLETGRPKIKVCFLLVKLWFKVRRLKVRRLSG
ncbi:MAG: hypothetical protein F6J99_25630 [Moorea sp. SIO4G3]|nr:hypothetical protein [Moorena sp. SIO4G3]